MFYLPGKKIERDGHSSLLSINVCDDDKKVLYPQLQMATSTSIVWSEAGNGSSTTDFRKKDRRTRTSHFVAATIFFRAASRRIPSSAFTATRFLKWKPLWRNTSKSSTPEKCRNRGGKRRPTQTSRRPCHTLITSPKSSKIFSILMNSFISI